MRQSGSVASTINALDVTGTLTVDQSAAVTAGGFTLDGNSDNTSGTLDGPGTVTVTGAATLENDANLGTSFSAGTGVDLILEGATDLEGYVYMNQGSELENQGTLTLGHEATLHGHLAVFRGGGE